MTSADIGELAKALAAAQGEFPPIPKDCVAKVTTRGGQSYSFRYADLETILGIVRPVLSRHGIMLSVSTDEKEMQLPAAQGKAAATIGVAATVLLAKGAERLEVKSIRVPVDPDALHRQYAQAVGSAATYSTRYAIEAALAIRATEDTDGSEATGNATTVERTPARQAPPPPKTEPTKPQLIPELVAFLDAFGWPKENKKDFATRLIAHYDVTLADLVADTSKARAVLMGLEAEVKAIMDADKLITDRADALQVLFSRTMEKQ